MCGVVAMYSRQRPVASAAIDRAVRALRHRGPDGDGRWISANGQVGLGHARLSIIDLETGSQPISNEDGTVRIVVNGEFYDHDRIRRELMARGHKLRTASDSEIALHLYEDFGVQCLEHLRGEFAFVLWDERNKVLLAVRDRFGIKPLNYAEVDGILYLGSEIKALFAAGVEPRWDREQVYQRLMLDSLVDRTLFAGVHQVPPGHCLIATPQSTRLVRYWDFNYPVLDALSARVDENEYVERLRAELLEAVRLRLRADVPMGCYLSGGVDSCAMLGMASHLRGSPITAFSLSFEDERYDEAKVAAAMARRVGAEFHCFAAHDESRADGFTKAVMHNETVTHSNMVAKFLLSERVRDLGYKVVLTGEGSDEIFAGYTPFRWDKILDDESLDLGGKQALFARIAGENAASLPGFEAALGASMPLPMLETVRRRLGFVPSWLGLNARCNGSVPPLLAPEFTAEFGRRNPYSVFLDSIDFEQLLGRPRLHQSMYLWSKLYLPNRMLSGLGDRLEMAHSIEGRVPFLDHKVVELVTKFPPSVKVKGIVEKHVLREAVRPFVTPEVLERRKQSFSVPSALRGQFGVLMKDILHSSLLDALPFFDRAGSRRMLADATSDANKPASYGIECLVLTIASMCVLREGFGVLAA
ncbi:MAG: asparagine synthase (glutamine-hydrolyzing) [Burkholderiaceae bacterium]